MSEANYSARERAMHKLAGAAYQMTFEGKYEMSIETMRIAAEFWMATDSDAESQNTDSDPLPSETATNTGPGTSSAPRQDARTDGSTGSVSPGATTDPDRIDLPSRGTKSRQLLVGILQLHAEGTEWLTTDDVVDEFGDDMQSIFGNLRNQYELFESKKDGNRRGGGKKYRVDTDVREEVTEELMADV